jgi:hypothetical protein
MNRRRLRLRETEHDRVHKSLSTYIDHELSSAEQERVKAHLAVCETCRHDLRTLHWTRGLLRETPPVRVPRSFVVREADIASPKPVRRRSWFGMQWAATVVAALFVLVLAGDMLTGAWLARGGVQPAALLVSEEQLESAPADRKMMVDEETTEASTEEPLFSVEKSAPATGMPTPVPDSREGNDAVAKEVEKVGETHVVTGTARVAVAVPEDGTLEAEGTPEPAGGGGREGGPETQSLPPAEKGVDLAQTPEQLVAPSPVIEKAEEVPVEEPRWSLWRSTRPVWRMVEVGLGVALVGLVIAIAWVRRRG